MVHKFMTEVRSGKRNDSIVLKKGFAALDVSDTTTRLQVQKELEDIGITPRLFDTFHVLILLTLRGAAEKGLPVVSSEESHFDKALSEININSTAYGKPVFAASSTTPLGETQVTKTLGGIKINTDPYERSVFAGPSKSSTFGTAADLFRAISEDDLSRVEELLDQGVDIESRDGSSGRTPLIASVGYDMVDIAELLLLRGADANAKTTNNGETALISACGSGRDKIIMLILQFGKPDLEARDRNGRTALMRASAQGYEREMRMLVKAGADLETRDKYGRTAYMEALRCDRGQAARLLINLGAKMI